MSVSAAIPIELVGPDELRGFVGHAAVQSRWFVPGGACPPGDVDPFLLLGIVGAALPSVVRVSNRRHALNYGLEHVRFVASIVDGEQVRLSVELASLDGPGPWVDARWAITVEGPRAGRVVLSGVLIIRYVFEEHS